MNYLELFTQILTVCFLPPDGFTILPYYFYYKDYYCITIIIIIFIFTITVIIFSITFNYFCTNPRSSLLMILLKGSYQPCSRRHT